MEPPTLGGWVSSREECVKPRDRLNLARNCYLRTQICCITLGHRTCLWLPLPVSSEPHFRWSREWLRHEGFEGHIKAIKIQNTGARCPFRVYRPTISGTDGETEAHAKRSCFLNVPGQKQFPSSTFILLLYQSAIYYQILTTWQRPIYNAVTGGIRLAYF